MESHKQLNGLSQMPKTKYIQTIIDQANYEPKDLYKIIRKTGFGPVKKQRHTPLPCLLKDGAPCQDVDEVPHTWLKHFAAIEGGYKVEHAEMLCKLSDSQQDPCGLPSSGNTQRARGHRALG